MKLAQHLQSAGHDVLVVVNRHPLELPDADDVEGVTVRRVPFAAPGRRPQALVRYARSVRQVSAALDTWSAPPDVLHVICASAQLAPLSRWARTRDVPLVITTQGETKMDAHRLYQRSAWMRHVLRTEAARATALSACSRWTAERTAEVAPAFRSAQVIFNGVDPEDWEAGPPPAAPVVCAWGRHVPQKGLDLLLDAFSLVREKHPDASLLIGGDGPESAELRRRAGHGVEFLGPLDRAGVREMLQRARVVVVPSRVEPFGIVAVEALAAGRSLVYSIHGGLGEAAGGLGIAVDPNDRSELAAGISRALSEDVDADGGRRRAAELSWRRVTPQYVRIYQRITTYVG